MQRPRSIRAHHLQQGRRGLTTPAIAIALLVLMMAFALIIDRIWLETAKLELNAAAEAAALAAARELANDDLLRTDSKIDLRLQNARLAAADIAAQNFVCGSSLELNHDPEGDIRFGYLEQGTKGIRFIESDENPSTVVVTAERTRSNNNPIALFVSGATKLPFGDLVTRVEASISNDVVGLRPIEGSPIPAMPLGIWEVDPSKQRNDTWKDMIENRQGADDFSFDERTHEVISGPDGIPEIVLRSMRVGQDPANANMLLLDLGTTINDKQIDRQIDSGVTVDDLKKLDGQLWIGQGATLELTATPQFDASQISAFRKIIGECRICFLYSQSVPQRQPPTVTATCCQIVAVRILDITGSDRGSCDLTVQPAVMTTRTAMLAIEGSAPTTTHESDTLDGALEAGIADSAAGKGATSSTSTSGATPNNYVYKLRLTH